MKNLFKYAFMLMCIFMSMALISSCKDSDKEVIEEPDIQVQGIPTISASGAVNGVITVIATNTDWSVNVINGNDWLSAFKNGNQVGLQAKENTTSSPRQATVTVTATANSNISRTINLTQEGAKIEIKVSPTVELLGDINSTTSITVNTSNNTTWTVSGAPDWLSFNKSGVGSSTITITAIQENFSDVPRESQLTFTTTDGSASAVCTVSQKGVLASNCRVTVGTMTVMCDGFAADLSFDNNCKGYREAFLKPSALKNLTDRDIFNLLMNNTEYSKTADYTYSPIVSPGTEMVYCVAAYGSESNADGTHKYGPITMKTITTSNNTYSSDMSLTFSYTSSVWKVITSRAGSYGQKCDEYYYLAAEEDYADAFYNLAYNYTYAVLAHLYLKPAIAESAESYYLYGPQTLTFTRNSDKFFLCTWGTDRDTKAYSAEFSWLYKDVSSSSAKYMNTPKNINTNLNGIRKYQTKADLPNIGKIMCSKKYK